jgi:hypothetical protein
MRSLAVRIALSAGVASALTLIGGPAGTAALAATPTAPAVLVYDTKGSPSTTFGQKFWDLFANGTGEPVRISIAPVVPGISVVPGNGSGPCTSDGPAWTWTCTMSAPAPKAFWLMEYTADATVADGTVLTSTITDDVAGLTASATVTFRNEAYVDVYPAVNPGFGGQNNDLDISLYSNGSQAATSAAVTVTGLQGWPTPVLPAGCQRSGDTVSCEVGAIPRFTYNTIVIPLGLTTGALDITATAQALPNGLAYAPATATRHFDIVEPPSDPGPVPTTQSNPPPPSGGGPGPGGGGGPATHPVVGDVVGDVAGPPGEPTATGSPGPATSSGETSGPGRSSTDPAVAAPGQATAVPPSGGIGLSPMVAGAALALVAGIAALIAVRRRRLRIGVRGDVGPAKEVQDR